MKTIATPAIILRRIDFGEADRILTLLTPENGKISVIAKGSRKAKSRLAGGLELFSVSNVTIIDGKSELKTVVSAQLQTHYSSITSDLDRTMFGYECLKTINKITEIDCDSDFFVLLHSALDVLADQTINLSVVELWFYMKLLQLLGVEMNIATQVDGTPFDEGDAYNFDFDKMGFLAQKNGTYTPRHIKLLRLFSKVSSPRHLLHIAEKDSLSFDLTSLLRSMMKLYVS